MKTAILLLALLAAVVTGCQSTCSNCAPAPAAADQGPKASPPHWPRPTPNTMNNPPSAIYPLQP